MDNLVVSEETAVAPSEVFLDGQSITEIDLESTCNEIVGRLNESGDTNEIESAIKNLNGVEKFAAKAKAKLVFAYSQWFMQANPGVNFAEWYVQTHGGDKLTVQKHQAVGELLTSDEVPDSVKQLPHKELISVARAKQGGYDLSDHWEEIALAGSESEVNDIVRKAKGKEKRAGSLDIVVHDDGSIVGWEDGEWVSGGWLNFADRDNEEVSEKKRKILVKMLNRIINNSGARTK